MYAGSFSIAVTLSNTRSGPEYHFVKDEMKNVALDEVRSILAQEAGLKLGVDSASKPEEAVQTPKQAAGDESRPPSPPKSPPSTPRVSIAPCPARLREFIPPPNYGTVEIHAIYRSSYPQDRHMDFVKSLKIRNVLTLVDTEGTPGYDTWIQEHKIKQTRIELATNKDGNVNTTLDSICEALLIVMDSANYPLYIHCNQGKHRTGCIVGCLRKIQNVPMDEILSEYRAYAGKKARDGDIELIKSFDPDLVLQFAKKNGYFDGPEPRLSRLDSWITTCDQLAGALATVAVTDEDESQMWVDIRA